MSQKAKRVWTAGVVGFAGLGVAAAALLIWQIDANAARAEEASPSLGPGQAESLDPLMWSRVRELRERLRLSDGTLAAVGCTQEVAEGVLTRVLAWYEANGAQWATCRRGTAAARKALRLAVRRLNVGLPEGAERPDIPQLPFDELRTAKAALAAATTAEANLLATCREDLETLLTDSQKGVWSTIRGNPATAVEYACAPDVTKAHRTALCLARTKAARRRAAAGNGTAPIRGGSAAGADVAVSDSFTPGRRAAIVAS
jgi:hypothetical protein